MTVTEQHPSRHWLLKSSQSHVTVAIAGRRPSPSPDRRRHAGAPPSRVVVISSTLSPPLRRTIATLYRRFAESFPDRRNVLAAEALLCLRGALRELRCPKTRPELGSPSAAPIPAAGRLRRLRHRVGVAERAPEVVRGQAEPGGGCDRREENHSSRKSYTCRWIFWLF